MGKPKILVTRQILPSGIDLLKRECDVEIVPEGKTLSRDEFLKKVRDKDGVLCLLTDKIDAEVFNAAPNVKGFANYAVGFDNMDVAEATKRGIPLSNTPDVLTDATAEAAWALLFAVARKIIPSDSFVRKGLWKGWGPMQFVGTGVTGKTLGIVGPGRIGAAMARMSRGFDMRILYSGHRRNSVFDEKLGAEYVSFEELAEKSDFISLHVPLTSETRHMFTESVFKIMKNDAVIINTARGPVIKEDDLLKALETGEIAGAGLDVFEFEPDVVEGLKKMDNVVITSHIGSATRESREAMSLMAAENLLAMIKGERTPQCVNPEIYG